MMFGNDLTADFSFHNHFSKDDFALIDVSKEVCKPGYVYSDAFSNKISYKTNALVTDKAYDELIKIVTEEVIRKLKI